jgi:hypothetical protein
MYGGVNVGGDEVKQQQLSQPHKVPFTTPAHHRAGPGVEFANRGAAAALTNPSWATFREFIIVPKKKPGELV